LISYLSWRFVEQPFRARQLAPTRRAAFGTAAVATLILLVGSAGAIVLSGTPSEGGRAAGSRWPFVYLRCRRDLPRAAVPAYDRWRHSAVVGSCAPDRGRLGVRDAAIGADARLEV